MRASRLYYFGPVIVWMAVIFAMSSRAGSTGHSAPLLAWLIGRVSPTFLATLSPYQLDCLDYAFRKTCHVTEYAILALLMLRAIRRDRPAITIWMALFALAVAVLYAATDEFHQRFVPMRTASVEDVLIDASGAAAALFIVWAVAAVSAADRRVGVRLIAAENGQEIAGEQGIAAEIENREIINVRAGRG